MLPLSNFFEKFKNLTNTDKVKKQLIVEIFYEYNIPVKIEQIAIIKNSLFIKTQPIIRTELNLKKEQIIKKINKIPGLSNISTIQ